MTAVSDLLMYRNRIPAFGLSVEFFPPKHVSGFTLPLETAQALRPFSPKFFSVTYGAGGSTREHTFTLAQELQHNTTVPAAAHITCVGQPKDELRELAERYKQAGMHRYVALRGDMPELGAPFVPHPDGFTHSVKLVEALRTIDKSADISVAAFPEMHPEALSLESDIGYLKEKLDAGADRAIMQYCFDTPTIMRFIERCRAAGITKPIIPGIMPVRDIAAVKRFSSRCGASVPEALTALFEASADSHTSADFLSSAATIIAAEQGLALLHAGAVSDIHIYSMNRIDITRDICALLTNNTH